MVLEQTLTGRGAVPSSPAVRWFLGHSVFIPFPRVCPQMLGAALL